MTKLIVCCIFWLSGIQVFAQTFNEFDRDRIRSHRWKRNFGVTKFSLSKKINSGKLSPIDTIGKAKIILALYRHQSCNYALIYPRGKRFVIKQLCFADTGAAVFYKTDSTDITNDGHEDLIVYWNKDVITESATNTLINTVTGITILDYYHSKTLLNARLSECVTTRLSQTGALTNSCTINTNVSFLPDRILVTDFLKSGEGKAINTRQFRYKRNGFYHIKS